MLVQWAFGLHIAAGTAGLVAGTVAVLAAKGARLHRVAGTVFFVSMLVMDNGRRLSRGDGARADA